MSLPRAALLAVRALPAEPAVALARLLVLGYLLFRPDCRAEIRLNLKTICSRDDRWFWAKNGWLVGRNLAIMARIGSRLTNAIIDRAMIYADNNTRKTLERNLHVNMVCFHYGLWELLPKVFARRGIEVTIAPGRQKDRGLAAELSRLRRIDSVAVAGSLAEVARSMRRRGLTGFMLDNTSQGRQEWFSAGGVRMRLPVTAFRLAARAGTGVALIVGFWESSRLRVEVNAVADETEALSRFLMTVRRRPEQWVLWGKAGALTEG